MLYPKFDVLSMFIIISTTISPLVLPGRVQSRKIIWLLWWVSTFSKLTSMGLDFHAWSNLKQLYPPSCSMTKTIVLFPDIWLTPPPLLLFKIEILCHNLVQKSHLCYFKIKHTICCFFYFRFLVSLFFLPWPPRNTKVGCSSPYSKLCWWFATFAKLVVSTFPPLKIDLVSLNLFTTSIKLQWCVSTFCWFPCSPLRQNHPKTIFLGPDSLQNFKIDS